MIIYVWNVMMDAYLYVEFIRPVIYSPLLIGGNLKRCKDLEGFFQTKSKDLEGMKSNCK